MVLAIDPGPEWSSLVLWDGERVQYRDTRLNVGLLACLEHDPMPYHIVIEWIASYGMPVGAEVFDTARWVGRFQEAAEARGFPVSLTVRREVKLHLCGQARAKDANIRQAIIDRFGGKEKAIGKKHSQGPLYGLKADEWQALALALTFSDLHGSSSPGPT
jgi:hypothetical protein